MESASEDQKSTTVAEPPINIITTHGSGVPINVTPEDITPERNRAVTKILLLEGQGDKPKHGDRVLIRYDSNLLAGVEVISRERQVVTAFDIGKNEKILIGVHLAVTTMKKGEISTFVMCHPPYNINKTKVPTTVSHNMTQLVFNIALLDWQPGDFNQNDVGSLLRQMLVLRKHSNYGCDGTKLLTLEKFDCEIYDKMLDITPEQNGGVTKEINKEGGGEMPQHGDLVLIRYDSNLVVDRTVVPTERKSVTSFCIGKEEKILIGMDFAVTTMRKGELSTVIIYHSPYNLLKTKETMVPPQTQIVLKIELIDYQLEDISPKKDGCILRKVLSKGEGTLVPNPRSEVSVCLVGKCNGKVFENSTKNFMLGEGNCHGIPRGLELALFKFQKGEKSVIYLKDFHGMLKGIPEIGFPPQFPVVYEVTMLAFQRTKELWEMNTDEKYEKAKFSKERGVEMVLSEDYFAARMHFKWVIRCLEDEPGVDIPTVHLRNDLLRCAYLNMALIGTRLGRTKETIQFCDKALLMDPDNEKALYRRGMAYFCNADYEEALRDFKRIVYVYPKSQFVKKEILRCQEGIKWQQIEAKNAYTSMFDKLYKQAEAKKKKTETGVWDDKNEATGGKEVAKQGPLTLAERLLQENDSVLLNANVIELSSNLSG